MNIASLNGLQSIGRRVEWLTGPDGARLLVLPHGGRVLGLFHPGGDENVLWTHEALGDAASARALFESDAWCNTGGDRTWLAPEADFFLPRYPDASVYHQPRAFDPGRYRCAREGGGIRLECDCELRSYRTGESLAVRIVKRLAPASNPCAAEPGFGGVCFAGYEVRAALELRGGGERTAVGLWHLLQLPHGGEMIIPTRGRSAPKVFFGAIPPRDLSADERAIRWVMRLPGAHKIGVRAGVVTGRTGYVWGSGAGGRLVVREFEVDPRGLYCDFPWDAPEDTGYAVQACNVSDAAMGRFSELEYHAPAIGGATGLRRREEVNRVWAFRGEADHLRTLAARLLGTGEAAAP